MVNGEGSTIIIVITQLLLNREVTICNRKYGYWGFHPSTRRGVALHLCPCLGLLGLADS